ncbi:MAG: 16S rRNA (guanine(966)-N(2))-methyltransferase RsmD [Tepidisphaerales bacterium]
MRIIAGTHRGRILESPPGGGTRPITDRAKQSLFDVLAPRLEGAVVADLFCGTGSMGLECLSRGAREAVFFEADRRVVAALRRNISALKLDGLSRVVAGDVYKLAPPLLLPQSLDLAFLDPPYRHLVEKPQALLRLGQVLATALRPDGLVVFRHAAGDVLAMPQLRCVRRLAYGRMAIELLARATDVQDTTATPGPDESPAAERDQ